MSTSASAKFELFYYRTLQNGLDRLTPKKRRRRRKRASKMAFMMRKKRYKFQVDLTLDELTEVTYSKAILLAKVRQLDGGNFTDVSEK